jgi:hypothetical protein
LTVGFGDVLITEGSGGPIGDVIRFNDATLTFFSATGGGSLADTGLPNLILPNPTTIVEGPNGIAIYTPALISQPGNDFNSGLEITYNFVSDTPLPAALPLFATGLGALGLLGWRRKRKAQAVG